MTTADEERALQRLNADERKTLVCFIQARAELASIVDTIARAESALDSANRSLGPAQEKLETAKIAFLDLVKT